MDGFVYEAGTSLTLGYYDYRDIPLYWEYAPHYVLLDNYFSSVMGPCLPNYLYLVAGQSGGIVKDLSKVKLDFPMILGQLDARNITWKSYKSDGRRLFRSYSVGENASLRKHLSKSTELFSELANGQLAQVAWMFPKDQESSEHPPRDIRVGERRVVSLIEAIMRSRFWDSAVIFLTLDDYGGWYDHVSPPKSRRIRSRVQSSMLSHISLCETRFH